jgi:asparagine synthetase A
MTEFQKFCKKNPDKIVNGAFEEFKKFYPNLSEKEMKQEFQKQMNEMFFGRTA